MSDRCCLLLLLALFVIVSLLTAAASNAEAARTKIKKSLHSKKRNEPPAGRKALLKNATPAESRRPFLEMEEQYLVSELEPEENGAVLRKAFSLLGIRYRFGGSTFQGIDCSAFVKKVYSVLSLPLPRTAREQYAMGREVPAEELRKGDLLFYQTYAGFPSHVAIYVGNHLMIHASSQGGRVMISKMNTPYFRSRFLGARRPSEGGFLAELAGDGEMTMQAAEVSS